MADEMQIAGARMSGGDEGFLFLFTILFWVTIFLLHFCP